MFSTLTRFQQLVDYKSWVGAKSWMPTGGEWEEGSVWLEGFKVQYDPFGDGPQHSSWATSFDVDTSMDYNPGATPWSVQTV
mmetsp:Transcript_6687/g.10572  ORF Transcript_6687/g.10572 Transcript_6687/m.10572 type:complete len:81 (-) Transcript_6687:865-1107(-)